MLLQTPEVGVEDVVEARDRDVQVVDVRSPEEFAEGHVPGAVNVPVEQVVAEPERFASSEVHVLCRSGSRSLMAAKALNAAGARAVSVFGGAVAWMESGREVERSGAR